MAIKLSVSHGDGADPKESVYDKDNITIGRKKGNDLVLPDPEKRVSGKHAQVETRGGLTLLIDLQSMNGTFLNERKIKSNQPVDLKQGDRITIGGYQIRFQRAEAEYDPTTIQSMPGHLAAELAEELSEAYTKHMDDPPEARQTTLKDLVRSRINNPDPEYQRAVLSQLRNRFGASGESPPTATMVRRKDQEITTHEKLYQAGHKAVRSIAEKFGGGEKLDSAEDVEKFGLLIEQALDVTFNWLSKCLRGRKEFEDQFSADLTMIFGKGSNPIKDAGTPEEIGKYLLNWGRDQNPKPRKTALEGAFKDLTMHQMGLLAGVQDCLKTVLDRLSPRFVEHELYKETGSVGRLYLKFSLAKSAWRKYAESHKQMFEENSKLFNEVIYPKIREGYLAAHAEAGEEAERKA